MNYETLRKIKQLDQDIKTGLVITAFYGNFYDKDDFDFYVRSIYLNKQIVEGIHKLGKEVHAWTVNSETEIERMKSIGLIVSLQIIQPLLWKLFIEMIPTIPLSSY